MSEIVRYATEEYVDGVSPSTYSEKDLYVLNLTYNEDDEEYVADLVEPLKFDENKLYIVEVTMEDGRIVTIMDSKISLISDNDLYFYDDFDQKSLGITTEEDNAEDLDIYNYDNKNVATCYDKDSNFVQGLKKIIIKEIEYINKITNNQIRDVRWKKLQSIPTVVEAIANGWKTPLSTHEYISLVYKNENLINFDDLTVDSFKNSPFKEVPSNIRIAQDSIYGMKRFTITNSIHYNTEEEALENAVGLKLKLEVGVKYCYSTEYIFEKTDEYSSPTITKVYITDENGNVLNNGKNNNKYYFTSTTETIYILFSTLEKYNSVSFYNGSLLLFKNEFKRNDLSKIMYQDNEIEYTPTTDYHPATKKYVDDKTASVPQVISEKVLCEVTQEQLATAWTQCQASTDTSMYIELPIFNFKDDTYNLHYIMINNKTYLLSADYNGESTETITRHLFEFYNVNDEVNNIYGGCIATKYDINWDDDETKVVVKIDRMDDNNPPVFTSNVQLIEKELMPFDYNYLGKNITLEQPVTIGSREEGEIGKYSISIGSDNLATEFSSFACGSSVEAIGYLSHAEGRNTIASSDCQHVQGRYNIKDIKNEYAHIVGNGTYMTRSNAHTLTWTGDGWYAGKLSQEGIPSEDKDVATKKYVDENGLTPTAKTLLATLLQNIPYSTDQSANVTAFLQELGVNTTQS